MRIVRGFRIRFATFPHRYMDLFGVEVGRWFVGIARAGDPKGER